MDDEIFLGGSSLATLQELGMEKIDWEPYIINPHVIDEKKLRYITWLLQKMASTKRLLLCS